jgi:hypothetical protein
MEFFTVPCPGKGNVKIDGSFQGESVQGTTLHKFQCGEGTHDISMECLAGKQCQAPVQRVEIAGTNPILPMEVPFECA